MNRRRPPRIKKTDLGETTPFVGGGKPRRGKERGDTSAPKQSAPSGRERLYGITPVEGALRAGKRKIFRILVKEGRHSPRLEEVIDLARDRAIPLEVTSPTNLEQLAGSGTHQGIVADCGALPLGSEKDALNWEPSPTDDDQARSSLLIALDEIQDPQNLGAVVRNAAVFGATGVVLPRNHSAPLSPAASKASAGWLEQFPLYDAPNLARFLDAAKKAGFWIAGTDQDGNTPLESFNNDQPLVLVLGNEGRGLRSLVREKCDFTLAIPTQGEGGLNVSSASAVLLYQLTLNSK